MVPDITGRVAIICVVSVFLSLHAVAQEGYYGVGHDRWHREFYSKLNRNDGRGTCCNLMDCRPTQSRMVGNHYEVKVDGEWTPVPNDRINNVVAPDGGAHVCAPRQEGLNKGVVFCVVLPPQCCLWRMRRDRSGQHHPRHMAWHLSPDYISELAGHPGAQALRSG